MGDLGPVAEELLAPITEMARSMFPNICEEYIRGLATNNDYDVIETISSICEKAEKAGSYPRQNPLKRKRPKTPEPSECDVEKFTKLYTDPKREAGRDPTNYRIRAKTLIQQDFPLLYSKDLDAVFNKLGQSLFKTYLHVSSEVMSWEGKKPAWKTKKKPDKPLECYHRDQMDNTIRNCDSPALRAVLEEFQAAREVHAARLGEKAMDDRAKQAEQDNLEQARRDGRMGECGCCMEDVPLNRMVHCKASTPHRFCCSCARRNAETAIGYQKHHFKCMSLDGCEEGFSRSQIQLFLDERTIVALDRLEMENALRTSGIENLESCPFCPFAAECAPVTEDREFRCQNEECRMVSCRLCREETHIPQTCEEAARDRGVPARRKIEEAMSAALIRKCNKCSTPFIKELGCNKMTCSKCGNRQCYVCGESCEYSHFDDAYRGGKKGNCPLFDNDVGLEQRHENEVKTAEEAARAQVQSEYPGLAADILEIKVSERVKKDEETKKRRRGSVRVLPMGLQRMVPRAPGGPAPHAVLRNLGPHDLHEPLELIRRAVMAERRLQERGDGLKATGEAAYQSALQAGNWSRKPAFEAVLDYERTHGQPIYVPDEAVPVDMTVQQRMELNQRFLDYVLNLPPRENEQRFPRPVFLPCMAEAGFPRPVPPPAPPFLPGVRIAVPPAAPPVFPPPDLQGGRVNNPIVLDAGKQEGLDLGLDFLGNRPEQPVGAAELVPLAHHARPVPRPIFNFLRRPAQDAGAGADAGHQHVQDSPKPNAAGAGEGLAAEAPARAAPLGLPVFNRARSFWSQRRLE